MNVLAHRLKISLIGLVHNQPSYQRFGEVGAHECNNTPQTYIRLKVNLAFDAFS